MLMDLILAYQENDYTEDLSAQLIFGGIGAKGSLPVTINEKWPSGFGIDNYRLISDCNMGCLKMPECHQKY